MIFKLTLLVGCTSPPGDDLCLPWTWTGPEIATESPPCAPRFCLAPRVPFWHLFLLCTPFVAKMVQPSITAGELSGGGLSGFGFASARGVAVIDERGVAAGE